MANDNMKGNYTSMIVSWRLESNWSLLLKLVLIMNGVWLLSFILVEFLRHFECTCVACHKINTLTLWSCPSNVLEALLQIFDCYKLSNFVLVWLSSMVSLKSKFLMHCMGFLSYYACELWWSIWVWLNYGCYWPSWSLIVFFSSSHDPWLIFNCQFNMVIERSNISLTFDQIVHIPVSFCFSYLMFW